MNQESHGWRDFFIAVVIMLVILLFAFWSSGRERLSANNEPVGNCQAGYADGSGC